MFVSITVKQYQELIELSRTMLHLSQHVFNSLRDEYALHLHEDITCKGQSGTRVPGRVQLSLNCSVVGIVSHRPNNLS